MKRATFATALAGVLLLVGATRGAATPADPARGDGCLVTDAVGDNYFDEGCRAHRVLKLDDEGIVAFFHYQDVGQLPAGAAVPTSTVRNTYEQCLRLRGYDQIVCGTVRETITPSGIYTSTFISD
ncbi:hypothetical protein TBR22_A34610 [Luteitalea sp. TBR-22]|nr:hypothetical protein TBR22_A34610 [Luteitalea sp. TBR-22]